MTGFGMNSEEKSQEYDAKRRDFIRKALAGEARWGAWRYNPENLTLEIDSEISGYTRDNPYYVDLERCNSSSQVLDALCQLLYKGWCPPEQVGCLLQAIDQLAGNLQIKMCSGGANKPINMREILLAMANEP